MTVLRWTKNKKRNVLLSGQRNISCGETVHCFSCVCRAGFIIRRFHAYALNDEREGMTTQRGKRAGGDDGLKVDEK